MEDNNRSITVDEEIKVLKLKVKNGTMLYDGRLILIYEPIHQKDNEPKQKKLKSNTVGVVKNILVKEGDIVTPGSVIVELEKKCNHPTVIKDLCAECGADLQKEDPKEGGQVSQASVSMVHMVPELKVNEELAQILGKADMDRLLEHKKLVLLVDLDQTLIHTTNDNIPNNIKDVYHFQLYGHQSPWYHTRLRPGTHKFLQGVSEKYELHICTFGSRRYAHTIARFLDPDGKFFSHRILSRDECFDPNSKTANLKALFPCGENMVCIIDDREDVWDYASNLIHVKPYHFFQHTGDIHAPPGLTKCENDDNKKGYDFSQINDAQNSEDSKSADQGDDNDEDVTDMDADDEMKEEDLSKVVIDVAEKSDVETEDVAERNSTSEPSKMEDDIEPDSTSDVVTSMDVSPKVPAEEVLSSDIQPVQEPTESENNQIPSENGEKSEPVSPEERHEGETENEIDKPTETIEEQLSPTEITEDQSPSESLTDKPTEEIIQGDKMLSTDHVQKHIPDEKGWITIEETDDYLLYLEEILKTIHAEFFKRFEDSKIIPDLKVVVPKTRTNVLEGVSMVFSGIVPNRIKLEKSQAYKIARSLGAKVTQNIESDTTHLVALRAGTAKVLAAYKRKNLKLVTPEWLWTCAERWEKVDERMFPLKNAKPNTESRHPPAHCRSPDHPEPLPMPYQIINKANNSQVGGFLYSINPLMSLSSEDIETMEGEVEDMFKESDGEAEGADDAFRLNDDDDKSMEFTVNKKRKLDEESSSSEEEEKIRKKHTKKHKKEKIDEDYNFQKKFHDEDVKIEEFEDDDDDDDDEKDEDTEDDETISSKFRRGEDLPSDLDIDYNTEENSDEDPGGSDGELNLMGAALEREFLESD